MQTATPSAIFHLCKSRADQQASKVAGVDFVASFVPIEDTARI